MNRIKLGAIAVLVTVCGVEATCVIGPAGTVLLHLPRFMAWLTWVIPPAVYLWAAEVAWKRRGQPLLYRSTREGLLGLSACLSVVAFLSSMTLNPGIYPAAIARGLMAAAGLVIIAAAFTSLRRPADTPGVG